MAKALFLSLPQTGHINPSLGLIRELATRGDTIVYFARDSFASAITASLAQYRPYRNAFLSDMGRFHDHLEQLPWLLTRTTAELLKSDLEAFRQERPDYLITDSVAPWGQWLGQILGVPVVTSVSTFAINRHILQFAASKGIRPKSKAHVFSKIRHVGKALLLRRQLQRSYGVSGPGLTGLVNGSSQLNIVYTSRYLQPRAETFGSQFCFVGPSVTQRPESAAFPWEQLRHPVVIYISLGTLFNADIAFYRACFEAFRQEDCQVVLSLGTTVAPSALGSAPDNFIIQPRVPQLEVLRRATAFVSHGGMNSVSESLLCGVPLVAVPQMGEQQIVAARVEELEAGLRLAKDAVTPECLRQAFRRLLHERRFREGAARVRASFSECGGVGEAADAIFRFTR